MLSSVFFFFFFFLSWEVEQNIVGNLNVLLGFSSGGIVGLGETKLTVSLGASD